MITTEFVPGSPCWVDLGAPDVGKAVAFYRAVFGWEATPMGEEAGDYTVFRKDGKIVAAVGALTEEGARSAWMIYYATSDAEAAAQNVERAGGTVRVAPTGGDEGRMAQFSDPLGGQFAVWQAGTDRGLEAVDEPGTLCWTELYTSDVEAAKKFYGSLFGWQTEAMPLPGGGGDYWIIGPAGLPKERMHGGMMQLPTEHLALSAGRPYWHPVFAVEDTDATVAAVTANGGSIQMGPEDAPGVGRLALCLDPSGADFVVLKPSPN
ncbi:VOC family protein [Kitasatospora sp. NPDC059571]|uniref:VOC family protein n=1 Tax=Kitasatospora sp. NPDC059571 TaxID=3346871 RepID=UPI0036789073